MMPKDQGESIPSIKQTSANWLRQLPATAHVER